MNGPSSRPQRSSSTSRSSSRRATLSVGPGGAGGLLASAGSLSPQRAMRTRVLRERSNEPSVDAGVAGKSKEPATVKGATRAQQLQFAFGSKIIKPSTSKAAGMSAAAGGAGAGMPTRGRAGGVGAVAADAGPTRSRRERSARHEPQEPKQQQQQQQQQRASSRGRGAVRPEHHHQQQPASTPRGEQAGAAALKAQLEEREATIVELRRKLAEESAKAEQKAKTEAAATPSASDTLQVDGGDELNEGERATLRAVEEEARAEAEEKLARVEAVAGAGLSHLSEMQARVDQMIRDLKARRS